MSPHALRTTRYAPLKKKTVFVGMSGGVDSSVAAYLLKKQGYNVVGVFMRCFNVDGCAERDAEDARRVARHIGIPFYALDLEEEYKERVVRYMVEGYRAGLTPNPDVMCNREIKFGLFLERALAMGADYVATGHYVRRSQNDQFPISNFQRKRGVKNLKTENWKLEIARDSNKDQSYFLWTLNQKQLARCLFPIGGYPKPEVRKIALRAGLPTAEKKDSQGICFLGQVTLADFLAEYLPRKKGVIVASDGTVLGKHEGAHFVTVGQRHVGAAVRTGKGGDTKPHYVVSKDIKTNTITVAEGRDNPLLFKKELELSQVNIIVPLRATRPNGSSGRAHHAPWPGRLRTGLPVLARVRYRQPLSPATLYASRKAGTLRAKLRAPSYSIVFDEPQQFVAEGQSAVFYSEEGEMLGGGVITNSK